MKMLWSLHKGRVGLPSPELRRAPLGSANPFISAGRSTITSHLKNVKSGLDIGVHLKRPVDRQLLGSLPALPGGPENSISRQYRAHKITAQDFCFARNVVIWVSDNG